MSEMVERVARRLNEAFALRCTISITDIEIGYVWVIAAIGGAGWLIWSLLLLVFTP